MQRWGGLTEVAYRRIAEAFLISLPEVRRAIRETVKESERPALRARMQWYLDQLGDA